MKKQFILRKDTDTKSVQTFQMNFKEVETTATGSVKIKGFASTPDMDRYDDIIRPEAFANAMTTYMKNPIVLLQHNSDKPIGLVTEYNLTTSGLEVTCEITNNEDGCFEKIQNKTLRGFSIGWICNSCVYRDEETRCIREVTGLDLVEISVVSTPANPNTLFTLAKSLKKMFDEMKVEKKEVEAPVETPEIVEEVIEETPIVEETPAETPAEETKETPTIETETPQAETPVAEEETPVAVAEVLAPDPVAVGKTPVVVEEEKSDVVEADIEAEEVPEGASLEEVEALAKSIVDVAVENAVAPLLLQIKELKALFDALAVQTKAIETDILKIEVPSIGSRKEAKSLKRELTYNDL